ncbi:MAG TPA: SCO family protein [Pyrinomonadaceae bacterium]|nr:SCO family protein [Pyrinomonadaceae bacterium]
MKPQSLSAVILLLGVVSFLVKAPDKPPGQKPKPLEPSSLQQPEPVGAAPVRSAAEKYFSDVELINQDGHKMRFYSDVLKDKVVVINTFFTTCTGVCPPINRNLEKVQEALGDRLGKEAFLVSMSVDPETDTPARLKEYSRRFHARPGWIFLTGKKENVDWALYKLGQYVETKDGHTNIIIIGNEPKGLWKKAFGLAKADELIKMVEDVISDR